MVNVELKLQAKNKFRALETLAYIAGSGSSFNKSELAINPPVQISQSNSNIVTSEHYLAISESRSPPYRRRIEGAGLGTDVIQISPSPTTPGARPHTAYARLLYPWNFSPRLYEITVYHWFLEHRDNGILDSSRTVEDDADQDHGSLVQMPVDSVPHRVVGSEVMLDVGLKSECRPRPNVAFLPSLQRKSSTPDFTTQPEHNRPSGRYPATFLSTQTLFISKKTLSLSPLYIYQSFLKQASFWGDSSSDGIGVCSRLAVAAGGQLIKAALGSWTSGRRIFEDLALSVEGLVGVESGGMRSTHPAALGSWMSGWRIFEEELSLVQRIAGYILLKTPRPS
ncbi:hypothetical protein CPB83DRAFT_832375 [Crepidotus variabilis]|uniref:Uncharacterized protein n=1 Tax=Crepidotus variabilis TaxID=179855 RepID=A0A9P6JU93_9AGAR|nr:hypothetical protein CPB83DRAFT_832375 [Crepidotus variabilis]